MLRERRLERRKAHHACQIFVKLVSSMSDSLPIIEATYRLYKQVYDINQKLAKQQRYGIGISAEQSLMALLEQLFLAQHSPKPHKATYLLRANAQLDTLRLKLRLYLELELANETRLFQSQAIVDDIGRMLGGWLRSLK